VASDKVRHVLRDRPRDGHTCHWPGCDRQVPPAMLMCRAHWFRLPKALRDGIWRAYRPGQENDKSPSPAWLDAWRAVKDWIASQPTDREG
jgi:hypothetical protein